MTLHGVTDWLRDQLGELHFAPPVAHVYNPLEYAAEPYRLYLDRFGSAPREVVLLGMNPGPFGMVQTGVPFGDVESVRGWLGIEAPVARPALEHPKRPVLGFDSTRAEVSGRRIWSWAKEHFGTADRFFERFFVANYCPLAFLESGGRNRTPDKLPRRERDLLFQVCDEGLRRTVTALGARQVVGIGRFAEQRARRALDGSGVKIGMVLHPSPASPMANRGWADQATAQIEALGISLRTPRGSRAARTRRTSRSKG